VYNFGIDSKKSDPIVIYDPEELLKKYEEILISASKEVFWIFHSSNTISYENKGLFETLRKLDQNIMIQVLIQRSKSNDTFKKINTINKSNQNIEFREIEVFNNHPPPISFLLVDKRIVLVIVLKDKIGTKFSENIDFGILNDKKYIISTYYYIFNLLWYQTDLRDQIIRQNIQLENKNAELVDLFSDLRTSFEALAKTNKNLELANFEIQRQKNKQIEFLNMSAHELRTPTQAISGYIEMIKIFPQNLPKYLIPIERNVNRLNTLIADLFSIAKIESGNLRIKKTEFDIIKLTKETIIDCESRHKENHNNFKLLLHYDSLESFIPLDNTDNKKENEENQLFVKGDRIRIFQVISNLINNAIKFTDNGDIIVKIIKKKFDEIEIRVLDNGKGIDPIILPKLFTKFTSTSDFRGGTGLGLFISRKIIEQHGGRIWGMNNPNSKGKGAEFGFIIPSTM